MIKAHFRIIMQETAKRENLLFFIGQGELSVNGFFLLVNFLEFSVKRLRSGCKLTASYNIRGGGFICKKPFLS
jgi:hypothetical protein